MSWDMERLRKIAGLQESESYSSKQLNERYDDDEDDPDVKAAMDEAKKRKIKLPKVKDVDPDKDIESLARSRKSKDSSSEKTEEPKKEEPKKEEPAAEKKRKGKAPQEGSYAGRLRSWIQNNPGKSRKEAWEYAQSIGMTSKPGFSTQYQSAKGKKVVTECYVIRHPVSSSFILSEDVMMKQYKWISDSDIEGEPMVFETKEEAKEVATYLANFKGIQTIIDYVNLVD
ncbi:MAG: hypothetical protein ACXW2E_01650 [Nitrososphaeraceae archaeon]